MTSVRTTSRSRVVRLLTVACATLFVAGCAEPPDGAPSSPAAASDAGSRTSTSADAGQSAVPTPDPSATPAGSADGRAEDGTAGPTAGIDVLVEDFPTGLIPVLDDSEVLTSNVEATGDVVAVSLIASTSASTAEVLDYYDDAFTGVDFRALEEGTFEGAASQTYSRGGGRETVNISAIETDPGTTYTIGAHVLPESVK